MRKTKIVTIERDGRDKGKSFLVTEMPAVQAEKWAARVFLAMAHSGVEVPPNIIDAGIAGIAVMGLRSLQGVNFEEAEPLLDEMMTCVRYAPDGKQELARPLVESDIEEVPTILKLRAEVFQLHVDFSWADVRRTFQSASATTSPDSSDTQTSRDPSQQPSAEQLSAS